MKVLVTGGTGFIGQELCQELTKLGHKVIVTSRKESTSDHCFKIDLNDPAQYAQLPRDIDVIYNLCGQIPTDASWEMEKACYETNIYATRNLLNFAREINLPRFIQISSLAVYGNKAISPAREEDEKNPGHAYGLSKLTAEYLCQQYLAEGREIVILRPAHVYGPGQNSKAVITLFLNKALNKEQITIHGQGQKLMDFIYLKDLISALILVLNKKITGTLNLSNGEPINLQKLAETINKICANGQLKIIYDTSKTERDPFAVWGYYMNIDKIKRLGFQPRYDLEAGIADYKRTIEATK